MHEHVTDVVLGMHFFYCSVRNVTSCSRTQC